MFHTHNPPAPPSRDEVARGVALFLYHLENSTFCLNPGEVTYDNNRQ